MTEPPPQLSLETSPSLPLARAQGKPLSELTWLYISQAIAALLPLAIISHVAPMAGVTVWAQLAMAEAIGRYAQVVVEYGFMMTGLRAAADPESRELPGALVGRVLATQAALACVALPFALALGLYLVVHPQAALMVCGGIAFGIAQAMVPSWFYQAHARMKTFVRIDIAFRLLSLVAVYVFVTSPERAGYVLPIMAFSAAGTCLTAIGTIAQQYPLSLPTRSQVMATLKGGLPLFAFRASGTLYISLNVVIIALLSTSREVGLFAAAERIVRLSLSGLYPLSQVAFSMVSRTRAGAARRVAQRRSTRWLIAAAIVTAFAVAIPGRIVLPALFGPDFLDARPVLAVFSVVLALASINTAIAAVWLLPEHQDRLMTAASIAAGVINVIVALLLAPWLGAMGMAIAVTCAEGTILAMSLRRLRTLTSSPV